MKLENNVILITGGASGIGLALAERLLKKENEIIICGRRVDKLNEVKEKYPLIHTRVCDLQKESDRIDLHKWITKEFLHLNVLINNAGIQNMSFAIRTVSWPEMQKEILTNLEAPLHLSQLFTPLLLKQPNAAIINVTSGLAFVPMASSAVYCATKAALHSFTLSIRHQLAKTQTRVIEIIPPMVETALGGAGKHKGGMPPCEFAQQVISRIEKDEVEIAVGSAERLSKASHEQLDELFQDLN